MGKKKEIESVEPKKVSIEDWAPVTGRCHLLDPRNATKSDHYVDLAGVDSDEFAAAVFAMVQKNKGYEGAELTDEQKVKLSMANDKELAARCAVGWDEDFFGPFSLERAIEVFTKYKWVYVQVQKFLDDRSNFYAA